MEFSPLEHHSPIPLYYQLQELLKQEIESGRWVPGDRLPSEPKLAEIFQVNRMVVRQALGILQADGQVTRVQGRGTFVSTPKIDHSASGLMSILHDRKIAPTRVAVLDSQRTIAHGAIRENLGVAVREPVLCLTTKFFVHDMPVAVGRSYFRWKESGWLRELAVAGQDLSDRAAIPPRFAQAIRSDLSVESTLADVFESEHLGVPEKSPVFLILCTERILDGAQERPYEVARLVYRTDVVQFNLAVAPPDSSVSAILGLSVS